MRQRDEAATAGQRGGTAYREESRGFVQGHGVTPPPVAPFAHSMPARPGAEMEREREERWKSARGASAEKKEWEAASSGCEAALGEVAGGKARGGWCLAMRSHKSIAGRVETVASPPKRPA